MPDEVLVEQVRHVSVFARVTPQDKLRIVTALHHHEHVVAVTGDGINDAPALKAAEIGVAMGRSGTDVAREASDMVLADDNFVSVYRAVEQGRITFDNLRKTTFFLVSSGAAEVMAILTALALRWPLLFLPAQILWLNLVTNGLQDVALAFEPGEPGVLERPPRRPRGGILSPLLWERTVVTGLAMAAGTLLIFGWALQAGSLAQAQTAAVTTMVLFQAFHAGNSRSEHASIMRTRVFGNRFLLAAVAAALVVHVAAIHLPAAQFVLRFEPFPPAMWPVIVLVAASVLVVNELHKVRSRARMRDG
jgi:cation-transporting P-type ATPase F